jgi:hypothetical protein
VERYLNDEPIEARPPSAWYRFAKFARRHKAALVTVSVVAQALVLGTVVSVWQALRATTAEGEARRNEEAAEEARQQAEVRGDALAALNAKLRQARYIADMNLAHHSWAENNLIRTRELLELHRPTPSETDLRGFEWHYLNRLFHGELRAWQAHAGNVTAIAFTSDGKRLFSCGRVQPRRSRSVNEGRQVPREIKLWDVATGRQLPLGLHGPTDKVIHLAVSLDGTRLAAACGDQGIRLWDLTTGQESTLPRQAKDMIGLAWTWHLRLAERGKDATHFPTALASYAARAVKSVLVLPVRKGPTMSCRLWLSNGTIFSLASFPISRPSRTIPCARPGSAEQCRPRNCFSAWNASSRRTGSVPPRGLPGSKRSQRTIVPTTYARGSR